MCGEVGRYAHVYSAHRGKKMVLDALELELREVVLPGMDPGNRTPVLCENRCALDH